MSFERKMKSFSITEDIMDTFALTQTLTETLWVTMCSD